MPERSASPKRSFGRGGNEESLQLIRKELMPGENVDAAIQKTASAGPNEERNRCWEPRLANDLAHVAASGRRS